MPYLDSPPRVLRYLIDCNKHRYFITSALGFQDGRYYDYLQQWAQDVGSQVLRAGGSEEQVEESLPWEAVFDEFNSTSPIERLYNHVCQQQ